MLPTSDFEVVLPGAVLHDAVDAVVSVVLTNETFSLVHDAVALAQHDWASAESVMMILNVKSNIPVINFDIKKN